MKLFVKSLLATGSLVFAFNAMAATEVVPASNYLHCRYTAVEKAKAAGVVTFWNAFAGTSVLYRVTISGKIPVGSFSFENGQCTITLESAAASSLAPIHVASRANGCGDGWYWNGERCVPYRN